MNNIIKPKHYEKASLVSETTDQHSKGGLYVREDDQDWGSAGMNDIQNQSDISFQIQILNSLKLLGINLN